jgi:DNA-binding SARP family transcriptional activator/tetratricopeptide (TPR) repeat protein
MGQDKWALTFEDSTSLRIYLLGPPRVESSNGSLVIPRRQARALLYRLATTMEPTPREQLCYLLWPDEPESSARRHLSHLITHLHRALPHPEPFTFAGDQIGLNPKWVWSDVATFERLCAKLTRQGAHHPLQGKDDQTSKEFIASLESSVNLYQGAFLEGFSLPTLAEFEEWVAQQRYALERLYLLALGELIEYASEQGKFELAILYAQRYLDTDPLAEDIHRRLIELYAVTGNRNAAVRQFEICAHMLDQELGVSPLPETRAAYQDALEKRISLKWTEKPTWKSAPGVDVPLIGRSQAMGWLEEAVQKARGENEKVILISGEAGIGKSRLLHEFIARLSRDAAILIGYARPEVRTLPYFPIIQALRSLYGLSEKKAPAPFLQWLPQSLDRIWLIEVSRVLPELRRFYPDLPLPLPAASEEAQSRLFEALAHFVTGLSASPVFLHSHAYLVLCLEDLHWADSATLDWLVYLGRQIRGHHLLVLGTYRSEEAEAVVHLRQGLHAARTLCELQLSGLDIPSILLIISHLTGGVTAGMEEFAENLRSATGGNPFFLIEILKAMMERGWLPETWGTEKGIPLPDTVREAIETRLQPLSSVGRQVLEAGAIAGLTFTFDLVRGIAGRREMEVVNGLDELEARELVVEHGSEYRFHHELVKRVVYEALSPLRRQLLHRRAGWMLTRLTPEDPGLLAHHFDLGGEVKQALFWYEQTTQQTEALFAWKEAEQYQNRMLSLLDQLDPHENQPDNILRRGLILLKRAHYYYLQGRLADRDADLKSAMRLAEKLQTKTLSLLTLLHHVRYLNLGGEYEKAIALAEEGTCTLPMEGLSSPSMSTLALIFVEIAFAHYFLGQPQKGFSALHTAQDFAGPNPDPKVRGPIEHHLGYMLLHQGKYAEALRHQQEALHCHQMCQDFNGTAWAELDLGFLYLKLGHFRESKTHLEQSLQLALRISAQPAEVYARTYIGYWKLYQGDYHSAIEYFRQTIALHCALLQEHGAVAAEIGWGFALYHLGEISEARARFQNAVDRSRGVIHRRRWAEALIGLGLVELKDRHPELARDTLNEAVELARLSQCNENLAAGLAALAQVEREMKNLSSSLAYSDEALRVAQQFCLPICESWAEVEMGLSLLAMGEQISALEHTTRAIYLLPQAYEGWLPTEEVYITHAKVLQALGRFDEAQKYREQARHLIEKKSQFILDPIQHERYLMQKLPLIS